MSVRTDMDIVGEMVQGILPKVNDYFDWEYVKTHYDSDPTGVAMAVQFFTRADEEEPVETLVFGVVEDPDTGEPRVDLLGELTADFDYLGTAATYQEYGTRILDPDDDLTPEAARYQYGGVDILPAEGESPTRLWYVVAELLKMVNNTLEREAERQPTANTED